MKNPKPKRKNKYKSIPYIFWKILYPTDVGYLFVYILWGMIKCGIK